MPKVFSSEIFCFPGPPYPQSPGLSLLHLLVSIRKLNVLCKSKRFPHYQIQSILAISFLSTIIIFFYIIIVFHRNGPLDLLFLIFFLLSLENWMFRRSFDFKVLSFCFPRLYARRAWKVRLIAKFPFQKFLFSFLTFCHRQRRSDRDIKNMWEREGVSVLARWDAYVPHILWCSRNIFYNLACSNSLLQELGSCPTAPCLYLPLGAEEEEEAVAAGGWQLEDEPFRMYVYVAHTCVCAR